MPISRRVDTPADTNGVARIIPQAHTYTDDKSSNGRHANLDKLRPYEFHGVHFEESHTGKEATADCPFCGKESKFSVNLDTGLWKCWVCGTGSSSGGGNALTFIRVLYEHQLRCTHTMFAEAVSEDRDLLSVATVETWGVCSSGDGSWLLPGYGPDGKLDQLYRRGVDKVLYPTPGVWTEGKSHALFMNATDFDAKRAAIVICEGPWDGMALWEVERQAWGDANIIAVPGCNVWKDEWTEMCRGKMVTLLYDSDHPTGPNSSVAGWAGVHRVCRKLSGVAALVRVLRWGPDGYDADKPSGWDVRDALTAAPDRRVALVEIMSKVEDAPKDWFSGVRVDNGVHVSGNQARDCSTWEECEAAWDQKRGGAIMLRQDLSDVIAVCLAVAASIRQSGNQLFLDIIGSPGSAKCLGEGTPILMYDGYIKNVEDIVVGDTLIGPDSLPRKVLSINSGEEELYVVSPVKGDQYIVNESHILSLKMSHKSSGYNKDEIANISVRDYIEQSTTFIDSAKGWRSGVDWPEKRVEIDPYFLGLWLGDGHSASLRVTTKDNEVVQAIREYGRELGVHVGEYHQGNEVYVVSLSNGRRQQNILHRKMVRLNMFGNKHVPHIYKVNSRNVRLNLLAGLLDTDGTMSLGGFNFTSKIESLSRDVAFIARSLGLAAYITKVRNSCMYKGEKVFGTYWRVSISGDCSVIPTRIQRKKASPRKQIKDVLKTGITLDSVGPGKYYGFTLEGDGLFLLGDFTVTHNTTICQGLLTSDHCVALENMTKLISGYKKEGDSTKDCSFLARNNNKMWVTCEFDVLGSSPEYTQLMGKARRIFDGETTATYGNDDEDRKYGLLRTPWVRCGTHKMMDRMADRDQSQLGDRFLRIIIGDPNHEEKREITRSALRSERRAMLNQAGGPGGSVVDEKTQRAHSIMGGYVNWLVANVDEMLSKLNITDAAEDYCLDLAELSADLRARPNEGKFNIDSHDTKEMPTRLARQNIRLASCLAVVLNKTEIDDDVFRIVRKVALDTAAGHSLNIVNWMSAVNMRDPHGRSHQECGGIGMETLAMWASMTPERAHKYLMFMKKIGVVDWHQRPGTAGTWLLTERVQELYARIIGGVKL